MTHLQSIFGGDGNIKILTQKIKMKGNQKLTTMFVDLANNAIELQQSIDSIIGMLKMTHDTTENQAQRQELILMKVGYDNEMKELKTDYLEYIKNV